MSSENLLYKVQMKTSLGMALKSLSHLYVLALGIVSS